MSVGRVAQASWFVVAAMSAFGLVLLATNRGFYNADELDLLTRIDEAGVFRWQWFTVTDSLFYRPLGYALFSAQLAVSGGSPALVHTQSVLHHVANCALLAWVFRRLGLDWRTALLAFAPIAVPGVAWAAAAYDRWTWTFACLAAVALTSRGAGCLLAVPLFLVALVTKETAVTFAVPAMLVAWSRRGATDARWTRAAVLPIVLVALAFAAWRLAHGDSAPDYRLDPDGSALPRALRYAAFPFAMGSEDPAAVWSTRWLGRLGIVALVVLGLRGSWRWTIVGLLCATAPMAPIVTLPKVEGHYLYLATPGLLLVAAAALRTASPLDRLVLAALLVTGTVHSFQIAAFYRAVGSGLTDLRTVHHAAPPGATFAVHGEPWLGEMVAQRYAFHTRGCGVLPTVELVTEDRLATWIVTVDGVVRPAR